MTNGTFGTKRAIACCLPPAAALLLAALITAGCADEPASTSLPRSDVDRTSSDVGEDVPEPTRETASDVVSTDAPETAEERLSSEEPSDDPTATSSSTTGAAPGPTDVRAAMEKLVESAVAELEKTAEHLDVSRERYDDDGAVLTVEVSNYADIDHLIVALRKATTAQGGTLLESVVNRAPRTTPSGHIECQIEMKTAKR